MAKDKNSAAKAKEGKKVQPTAVADVTKKSSNSMAIMGVVVLIAGFALFKILNPA